MDRTAADVKRNTLGQPDLRDPPRVYPLVRIVKRVVFRRCEFCGEVRWFTLMRQTLRWRWACHPNCRPA